MEQELFATDCTAVLERIAAAMERIAAALETNDKAHKDAPKETSRSKHDRRRKAWSPDEDEMLNAGRKYKASWQEISMKLPGRTPKACINSFYEINIHKGV